MLRDKLEQRNKYGARAHESVEQIGVVPLRAMGDEDGRLFSYIQSLRVEIKRNQEELFYTSKELAEFPDGDLKKKIQTLINDLRSIGIFILPTEIEGQFVDTTILDSGKCSDSTIRNVREVDVTNLSSVLATDILGECIDCALA